MEQKRRNAIMQMLAEKKMVKTADLMKEFGVSSETIRRDFISLEQRGLLRKIYGGAVLENLRSREIALSSRQEVNPAEKAAIGQLAATLINDGETVVLNSGTTVLEVAKNLLEKKDLTIITNCISVASLLQNGEKFRIFLVGGELRKWENVTSGWHGNEFLSHFRADKAIIGIGGIDSSSGVTDYHVEEASIWRDMVRIAGKTILVADYSKFGVSALNVVCELSQVNYIVTDWKVPKAELHKFRSQGVQVFAAEEPIL